MSDDARDLMELILSKVDRSEFQDLIPNVPGDEVLASYVEGVLDPKTCAAIEQSLARHPKLVREVDELREFLSSVPSVLPEPSSLPGKAPPVPSRFRRVAAMACGALLCMGAGFRGAQLWDGRNADALHFHAAAEALESHPDARVQSSALGRTLDFFVRVTAAIEKHGNVGPDASPDRLALVRDARLALYNRARISIEALSKLPAGEIGLMSRLRESMGESTASTDKFREAVFLESLGDEALQRRGTGFDRAVAYYEKAELLYASLGSPRAKGRVMVARACALFALDRTVEALDALDEAGAIYLDLEDGFAIASIQDRRAHMLMLTNDALAGSAAASTAARFFAFARN